MVKVRAGGPGERTELKRFVLSFKTVKSVNKLRVDQPKLDFGE